MTVTHRTLEGGWTLCESPEKCALLFHFPDMTPEAMAGIPLHVLLPLLEVVDPPQEDEWGEKRWGYRERMPDGDMFFFTHREYDLPAEIREKGAMSWMQHDQLHRDNGPAAIDNDGSMHWVQRGTYHRDDDLPAMVTAQGSMHWWQHGQRSRRVGPAILQSPGEEFDPDERYWTASFYRNDALISTEQVLTLPTEWLPGAQA